MPALDDKAMKELIASEVAKTEQRFEELKKALSEEEYDFMLLGRCVLNARGMMLCGQQGRPAYDSMVQLEEMLVTKLLMARMEKIAAATTAATK